MKIITSEIVENKKILIRLDLDVPIINNEIKDLNRLTSILPTLHLLNNAQQITIMGHVGRPKGQIQEELRLKIVAEALVKLLGSEINYIPSLDDSEIKKSLGQNKKWNLLENLRFHLGEESNSTEFAHQLSHYGDIFVFEAFAVSHRTAASTVGITQNLPSYAGLRVAKEVELLTEVLERPQHPFLAIIGGAKIETKLPVIKNLSHIADAIFVGGKLIKEIQEDSMTFESNVFIGSDIESGFDIDENSQNKVKDLIKNARLIVWNGPPGKFEVLADQSGTKAITDALATSSAMKIIGGGETHEAVKMLGIEEKIDFISVGGGAMLDFLAGIQLPALQVL